MLKYVNTKFHDHPRAYFYGIAYGLWDGGLLRLCSASGK